MYNNFYIASALLHHCGRRLSGRGIGCGTSLHRHLMLPSWVWVLRKLNAAFLINRLQLNLSYGPLFFVLGQNSSDSVGILEHLRGSKIGIIRIITTHAQWQLMAALKFTSRQTPPFRWPNTGQNQWQFVSSIIRALPWPWLSQIPENAAQTTWRCSTAWEIPRRNTCNLQCNCNILGIH